MSCPKKNYDAILFDIDDTLVDFEGSMVQSLKNSHRIFFKETSFPFFKNQYYEINRKLWNRAEKGEIASEDIGKKRFEQLMEKLGVLFNPEVPKYYEGQLIENSKWIEGAVEMLTKLQHFGIKIGYVTNGFGHIQRAKYDLLGLNRFSEVLIISEEIGYPKPHPKIFQYALEKMGISPERTLIVGDSLSSDGKGAMKMGIDFCWYNPNNHEMYSHCILHSQITHILDVLSIVYSDLIFN